MNPTQWLDQYLIIRNKTQQICSPLLTEDYVVQPRAEVSPPKWHLGHTTWFFETFLLKKFLKNYHLFNKNYPLIFNSYYKGAGPHWIQGHRGDLSRPTVAEVFIYRKFVDENIQELLNKNILDEWEKIHPLLEVGLHHEQQHQELLLMDIKAILHQNPIDCSYQTNTQETLRNYQNCASEWIEISEGLFECGHDSSSFCFDNEKPKHKVYLHDFALQSHLVTNSQFQQFIADGGYKNPDLWFSKGWDWVQQNQIHHPFYWKREEKDFLEYTLYGWEKLHPHRPVCNINFFEANAFAKWSNCRLPTEFEWEVGSRDLTSQENGNRLEPYGANQLLHNLWCWTQSHYSAYPKYEAYPGTLGEYNGKFMCNQFVLRGGCFATPTNHFRITYRNFYEPHQSWMFSGIRLAKDL